jgi:hypothetical protein
MKKSILVAASALSSLFVFADAQVYEMTITLKSTVAASGKITPVVCDMPEQEVSLYRKQSTVKIKGLFWGCDCETIAEPQFVTSATATYGYIFWNETTHQVLDSEFAWHVLNRIDKKLKKAEGAWTIGSTDAEVFLAGSGFGTVKDDVSKAACTIDSVILSPMSGNCAGWLSLPAITVKGSSGDCPKCGEATEGTDDTVTVAPGWSLCACGEGSEFTAATGTWKLKYHAAASKKWQKAETDFSITKAYSFPSYVKTFIESL